MKDTDEAVQNANEEALKELKEGAQEDEDEVAKAPVVEPQDPEELEAKQETPRGEEKRRNRYREQVEARERMERENQELRTKLAAAEAVRAYMPQPQAQQTETKDEYEERIASLKKLQEDTVKTHRAIVGDTPEAEAAREVQRQAYMDAQDKIQRTLVEQAVKKNGGGQQVDSRVAARMELMSQRYSDVVNHPDSSRMLYYADGLWRAERARTGGQEPTQEATDRIFEQTRRQFGLAKSPTPSPGVRAKFQGTPVGARGSNGVQESQKKSFPMNKQYLRMARAAHPGKSDNVAFQLWVNDQNSD